MSKTIIAVFAFFAISFSLIGTASASDVPSRAASSANPSGKTSQSVGLVRDSGSISAWNTYLSTHFVLAGGSITIGNVTFDFPDCRDVFWNVLDKGFSVTGVGSVDSLMELKTLATKWNSALSNGFDYDNWNLFVKIWLTSDNKLPTPSATVKLDTATGVYRLYDSANNQWLVNSAGYYLYYKPETGGVSGGDTPAQEKGTWLPQNQVDLKVVHLVNAETLQDYADHYGGTVATFSEYLFCRKMENGRSLLLVDSQNRPYAVIRQPHRLRHGKQLLHPGG